MSVGPGEQNSMPLSPYAWAEQLAQSELDGRDYDDSWVVGSEGDEKTFVSASVRYAYLPDDVAERRALETLGGPAELQSMEHLLAAVPTIEDQQIMISGLSPLYRAAFMEIAARKVRQMFEGTEQ